MPETLGNQSHVILFGKIVEDLTIESDEKSKSKKPHFARIFGFSFGGEYVEMGGSTFFVVHGPGEDALDSDVQVPGMDDDLQFYRTLKTWSYEKSEQTMRLDMDTGTFEQILLGDGPDGGPGVSGARVSGARVSGARVSGARVSGARVSGARVSGARISGARGDASD